MSDEKKPGQPGGDLVKPTTPAGTPEGTPSNPENSGPTPEELAHQKRMRELFGDLDEDEEDPETIDDVKAERDNLAAQIERQKASVARTRRENSALMQRVNEGKDAIAAVDELRAQDKKDATKAFLVDLLPVSDSLAAGLKEIDAAERAANPKLDKLTIGVESTLNQLTAVFNKYGIKPGDTAPAPSAPAAPAAKAPDAKAPDAKAPDAKAPEETPPAAAAPETPAAPPAAPKDETIETLRAERDALMAEASQLASTVGKAQADNLTLQKRIDEGKQILARETVKREDDKKYAIEKPLKDLIPVIDTLELGLKSINPKARAEDPNFDLLAKVVEGTLKQVKDVFNKFGVKQLNPVGEAFDAEVHEAITLAVVPGMEADRVAQVVQKGYHLHDRSVRHPKVVVSRDPD